MDKERKLIEPNAIIVFDRDVNSSELSSLPADFKGDIVIKGTLIFDEDEEYTIKCDNLYANRVEEEERNQITIIGNLYVQDDIDVFAIKVNGSIYCGGNFNSTEVIVSEDFESEGTVCANDNNIFVGGDFTCKDSVEFVDELTVCGKFKAEGILNNVSDVCIG